MEHLTFARLEDVCFYTGRRGGGGRGGVNADARKGSARWGMCTDETSWHVDCIDHYVASRRFAFIVYMA